MKEITLSECKTSNTCYYPFEKRTVINSRIKRHWRHILQTGNRLQLCCCFQCNCSFKWYSSPILLLHIVIRVSSDWSWSKSRADEIRHFQKYCLLWQMQLWRWYFGSCIAFCCVAAALGAMKQAIVEIRLFTSAQRCSILCSCCL